MNRALASFLSVAFAAAVFSTQASGDVITYNASLGTLPEAQGFTFIQGGNTSPPPTVSGGLLYQGPTVGSSVQFWQRNDLPLDLTSQFSMEVTLHVDSSGYATNLDHTGNQRSGYYLEAVDAQGRALLLGISSGGIYVNNNDNDPDNGGTGFISFNTTNGFHNYLVTDVAGVVNLIVDGQLLGTTTIAGPSSSTPNTFYFADATYYEGSQTETAFVAYSNTASVPEPSSLILCGVGSIGLAVVSTVARRSSRRRNG
jgi:hypothetical protein